MKQDIVCVYKQDIVLVGSQDVVLVQKHDLASVQKQNIGPSLTKWGVMRTPLCGVIGGPKSGPGWGRKDVTPQNGVIGPPNIGSQ